MSEPRSPNIEDKPLALAYSKKYPESFKNLKQVINLLSRRYIGPSEGFYNQSKWLEYRYDPHPEENYFWFLRIEANTKKCKVRFYVNKNKLPNEWANRCEIYQGAHSEDLDGLDFEIVNGAPDNDNEFSSLKRFIEILHTFSKSNSKTEYSKSSSNNLLELLNQEFNPKNIEDGRERINKEIVIRKGQPKFRNELLRAYEEQCVISGCKIKEILEAAHITPYLGDETNIVANGLLLRADIHTLWDLQMIAINPEDLTIWVSEEISDIEYRNLEKLQPLLPKLNADKPSKQALASQWKNRKQHSS